MEIRVRGMRRAQCPKWYGAGLSSGMCGKMRVGAAGPAFISDRLGVEQYNDGGTATEVLELERLVFD